MTRTGCIYMATVNGKHCVGKTLDFTKRKSSHLKAKDDTHFHRAILKYRVVSWRILSDGIPETSLTTHECFWIRFYDTQEAGYNSTGGDGLSCPSEDVRSRISASLSTTLREIGSRGELACQRPDVRAKMSESHSATMRRKAERGELHAQSPEGKAQRSQTMRNKASRGELWNQQPEAQVKIREASARGEHPTQTPEARANYSRAMQARTRRGENPMHNPEIRDRAHTKAQQTMKAKGARGELWKRLSRPTYRDRRLTDGQWATLMTGIIYIATNQRNLKSYVGQTIQDFDTRKTQHLRTGDGRHFHNAIQKHGADAFEWRVLESDIPLERLDDCEELWIVFYDTFYNGYNHTSGGGGGVLSEETRAKQSESAKVRIAERGNHLDTPEVRARAKASLQLRGQRGEHHMQDPEFARKINAKQGETHRQKAQRGAHWSQMPENRKRCAERLRQKNPMHNAESYAKMVHSNKRTASRNRLRDWETAGQQFLLDIEV